MKENFENLASIALLLFLGIAIGKVWQVAFGDSWMDEALAIGFIVVGSSVVAVYQLGKTK